MVQNNKVLTVSYGTFSCTLEGFDDSFGTMKAIAEYFRDLAADDRYFGAEPPQPDADMLARIAQREISRQVEARRDSGGIVLRAAEGSGAAAIGAAAVSTPVEAEAPKPDAAATPEATEPAAHQPAPAPAPEAQAAPEPQPATEPLTAEAPAAEPAAAEAPAPEATVAAWPEPAAADFSEGALTGAFAPETEGAAFTQDAATPGEADSPEFEAELLAEPEFAPEAESIAAKLERIRAVVSRTEAAAPVEVYEEDEYSEDEHALDEPAEDVMADAVTGAAHTPEPAEIRMDEPESGAEDMAWDESWDEDDGDSWDEVADLTALDRAAPAEPESDDEAMDADDDDIAGVSGDESIFGEVDDGDDMFEGDEEFANILGEDDVADRPAPEHDIDVTRADLDASAKDGGALSPEDEADLMAQLAEVEAELRADDDDMTEEDAAAIPAMVAGADEGEEIEVEAAIDAGVETTDADDEADDADAADHHGETRRMEDTEEDLSRLMAAADEKLGDPNASSNREAYSHLRAAVAAAEAERSAGGTVGTRAVEDDDPYREDLASVVRPRRPAVAGGGLRRRASADRPAPLKLVAEQRVDLPNEPAQRGPVRPRRISSAGAESGVDGGFAAFAADHGAVELPELLEAAAAYLSFVEGHEQFSRPQLMNKVRQLDNQEFNREDGLRSFGQLLRDGKIEKTGGGQFTASGDIGFHPDKRAAG